ncbi:MAG TPA: hypothetical protein VHV51_03470 [Polyangiaceae bacterium]|nr:hypothetical protein [Polyangiaceae bacterium]
MKMGGICLGLFASVLVACSSGSDDSGSTSGGSAGLSGSSGTAGSTASVGGSSGTQGGSSGTQGGTNSASGAAGSAGSGATAVDIHCEESSGVCTCVGDPNHVFPADSVSCAASTSMFCCADDADYPASGACQCEHWACTDNGTECACGNGTGTLTTCPSSYGRCCKGTDTCDCHSAINPCGVDETEVPSCVLDDVACLGNESRIGACDGSGMGG